MPAFCGLLLSGFKVGSLGGKVIVLVCEVEFLLVITAARANADAFHQQVPSAVQPDFGLLR